MWAYFTVYMDGDIGEAVRNYPDIDNDLRIARTPGSGWQAIHLTDDLVILESTKNRVAKSLLIFVRQRDEG